MTRASEAAVLSPTCVWITGYVYDGLTAQEARDGFLALVEQVKGTVLEEQPQTLLAQAAANATFELYLKFLPGHDYCLLQIWVTPVEDDVRAPIQTAAEASADLPLPVAVEPLFRTALFTCQEPVDDGVVLALFEGGVPDRCTIYAGSLQVSRDEGRYLLAPHREGVADALISRAVDDVSRLEMFYRKVLSFYAAYPGVYERIVKIEDDTSRYMEAATEQPMVEWINYVSDRYVDLSNITRALAQDVYSIQANVNNVEQTLQRWGEQNVGSYLLLSQSMLGQVQVVIAAYQALGERVDAIRSRLNDVIGMVRTRSEVNRMRLTSFIQFVTTSIGLSGVANQMVQALQEMGLIPATISPATVTVFFIPIAILVAGLFTVWLNRRR